MKRTRIIHLSCALLLAMAPLGVMAGTFFSDNFTGGSTLNQAPVSPTINSTSYEMAAGISNSPVSSISPGHLYLAATNTSSVVAEVYALFTNGPASLSTVGDNVAISVVFVNQSNILSGLDAAGSTLNIGLFNSGAVAPNQGPIELKSGNATGGTQNWLGYDARIFLSGSCNFFTRPAQTPNGSTSQNQDLLFNGASGTQTFNNPTGTALGTTTGAATLTQGATYTMYFAITLTAANTLTLSNVLYAGAGTGGTVVFSQLKTTTSPFLASGFDGMAIGWRNSSSSAQSSAMDINSILVTGQSTPVATPPSITTQPSPVVVATNGSCAFSVVASGLGGLTYQWHRHGTNLLDGGNISGSTSAQLVISPAGNGDILSGANGYWVAVTGLGPFTTNSITNSLSIIQSTNLIWSGAASVWDVATTAAWLDTNGNTTVFNFGDPVTFDDSASLKIVNMTNTYLSAGSVTVDTANNYTFQGPGSFAGLGSMLIKGSGEVQIKNPNTYSGGTIISNGTGTTLVSLQNINGLGTGPVTFAKAGDSMEIVPPGNNGVGINGNIIVADDFTITFKSVGTFAGNFLGDFSGTAGKTLTLEPTFSSPFTNSRVRINGTNTVFNANILIDGPSTSQAQYDGFVLAGYAPSGSQTYNGIISGNGGFIQRGNGTTILNGANTYSGGTTPTAGSIGFGVDTVGTVTSGPIGTGPLNIAPEVGGANGNGQVYASGGARTIANPIQYPSGTNNQTLSIGGTNNLTFTGIYALNGQDGLGTPTSRILQVTNLGLTTFSGVVSDAGAGYGLTKTGSGVLALNNTETYTGPTTNSAGTLQINGSLAAASVVTVSSNATLAGTGTINGPVTIAPTGTLAPGTSAMGTLTINNSLTVAGNINVRVNRSGSASDKTIVSGVLTNTGTGTITVTNLGATLQPGDAFTLFSKPLSNGVALNVTGAGAIWTNKLAIDGSIAVASFVATTPTNISVAVSGNTLTLSWPANYLGWSLQSNSVSLTSTTNWFTVPNSLTSTQFVITVSPARTNVFYRLAY